MRTEVAPVANLLLTGGTGFFGLSLLRHWLALEQLGANLPQVTLLSRDPQRFITLHPEFANRAWLCFAAGDMLERSSLPHNQSFSHVLHAAADSTHGPLLTPLERYDQIVQGTRNLLDLACGCGARRFLLTSSGAVYGAQPAHLPAVDESWAGRPDPMQASSAYGMGKLAAEHLCALYAQAYGLQTVVARCFAFVGPDLPLDVHFAIGNFIRDALWADEITVHGNGSPVRSYMDQTDLACWLLALLEQGRNGQAYNVGSPEAISIADLAKLVGKLIAPGKPIQILGQALADGPRNLYVPNVSKAMGDLGLVNKVTLANAIANAAAAHSNKWPP